jgi:hypothetical protein
VEKKASKILSRFGAEIGLPSLVTGGRTVLRFSSASSLTCLARCRIALSARCDSTKGTTCRPSTTIRDLLQASSAA